jgi:predicted nucleic acid-binding protein
VTHGFDTSFLVAAEVAEHPDHDGVWRRVRELKAQGNRFALTALVLAEFVHIVTDAGVSRFR